MKISNREKVLLLILFISLVSYLFFTYVYIPQNEKLSTLKETEKLKKDEYVQMQNLVNSEGNLDLETEEVKDWLLPVVYNYFGQIDQEETIIILDELAEKSGLNLTGITFSEPERTTLSIAVSHADEQAAQEQETEGNTQTLGSVMSEELDVEPLFPSDETNIETNEETESVSESPENFTSNEISIDFAGTYSQLMSYLVEIGNYYKHISSYSLQVESDEENQLKGTIIVNFYMIDSVDKYVSKEPNVLEYDFIPRSSKTSPFDGYSWAEKIDAVSAADLSIVGMPDVTVEQESGSQGDGSGVSEQTKEAPVSMEKTIELGSKNPLPLAYEIFDEKSVYGFDDEKLKTFTLDKGNSISGKLEKGLNSEENLYGITYTFDGEATETEVYIDLQSKKLTVDKKPQYFSLFVSADRKLDNMLGIIVTDSNGMDHRVFLANKIDRTNKKELRGILDGNVAYPVKIKNIFVRDNSDSSTKDAKLYFDELKVAYLK